MIWPTDILSVETWVLIVTLFLLARYFLHRKWSYLKKLHIPHDPPSIMKFGHLSDMFGEAAFTMDLENKQKFGPIWGCYVALQPNIVIHDVDILRQIFIKEFPSFQNRQGQNIKLNGPMNDGLTEIAGKQWKRVRSSMTPTFSTAKLKQMTGLIEWSVDNTIEVLNRKNKEGDRTFSVKELFSRLSLDIICSAAFSTKVHSQDDSKEEPEISKHAKNLFKFNLFSPIILIAFLVPPLANFLAKFGATFLPKESLNYFENLCNFVMKQKAENHYSGRVDIIQLMLDNQISEEDAKKAPEKGMTKKEIIANAMQMILAGYETTANSMEFLAYNLAVHPKIQEDVQKEIDEMMKDHGKFDYEGVNSLKMLDMCFNESLRLYMPIVKNARFCEKEITINGLTIPAGMTVAIPTYALAHDPEHWDEPFEFKPERMRDMSQIDPMLYQPFGAGPRNCIGMRFAVMEAKMAICKILYKFTFKPAGDTPKPPLEVQTGATIRPKVDLNLRAVPREDCQQTDEE